MRGTSFREGDILDPPSDHVLKELSFQKRTDEKLGVWTNEGFFGFVVGRHVASFVDDNKGYVPGSCAIPANGPYCSRDFSSRPDPPRTGGSLGILLMENAGEPFDPS